MEDEKANLTSVFVVGPSNRTRSIMFEDDDEEDYLYDRLDVRAVCIILYSIVFISCFFGNLIVILVVTVHWRMRSITNFCLANLAFADFCVSVFCVYQNMYIYFMSSWVFGAFLCKMYYFITELSHTASILILVVICIERYLAIVHPMRCKEWLTLTRLRLTIILVWTTSAIYSSPRLYFTNIRKMPLNVGEHEILCIPIRTLYDSQTFDMVSFVVLFALPLLVISILYFRIALALWESSKSQMQTTYLKTSEPSVGGPESCSSSEQDCDGKSLRPISKHSCADILCCGCDPCRRRIRIPSRNRSGSRYRDRSKDVVAKPRDSQTQNAISTDEPIVVFKFEKQKSSFRSRGRSGHRNSQRCTILFNGSSPTAENEEILGSAEKLKPKLSTRVRASSTGAAVTKLKRMTVTRGGKNGSRALESRRRIIKMLIIIVCAFAVCNLPFHARKIWQYYGSGYSGGSTFSSIFTPLTFLIMYANSGINPILYAFMSKKFRVCFMDLVNCKMRRSLKVARNASVRSTHIIPPSTPG